MRTQQQDAGGRLVTVVGILNANGSVFQGDDSFIPSKTGTGAYSLRFPGLKAIRSSVTTIGGMAGAAVPTAVIQPNQINVTTYSTAWAAVDASFHFTVTGYPK
jgi:hypothetical protein